jgi:MFS family permease
LQGIILGAYFYTYCMTQIPGGRLAERWGAKWVCGLGIFIPAIFNALIPISLDLHVSTIIIFRLIIGACHGLVFSALISMYTKWFPKTEVAIPIAGTLFGGNIGSAIAMVLTGYLCKTSFLNGWPSAFYVSSLIHIIWFVLWSFLVFNTPTENPRISQQELCHINNNIYSKAGAKNKIDIPWMSVIKSAPVWASIITKGCTSYGYFVMCTRLPQYLDSVFGMALHTNSWFNSFIYISLCTSLISSGPLSNYFISKNWCSKIVIRKIFQSIGNYISIN